MSTRPGSCWTSVFFVVLNFCNHLKLARNRWPGAFRVLHGGYLCNINVHYGMVVQNVALFGLSSRKGFHYIGDIMASECSADLETHC